MSSCILRAVFIYGLFTSLLSYILPHKIRLWFKAKAMALDKSMQAKDLRLKATGEPFEGPKTESEESRALNAKNGKSIKDVGESCEMRRVFSTFDKNGDGFISKEEIRESLRTLGIHIEEDGLCEAMANADTNGDGLVDFGEFSVLYESLKEEPNDSADENNDADLREAFNVFDENGDGVISVEELQAVLASLGLKQGRTISACRDMISSVDEDGDGMVSFTEFKRMMSGTLSASSASRSSHAGHASSS